jgi:hypothetical protein
MMSFREIIIPHFENDNDTRKYTRCKMRYFFNITAVGLVAMA